MCWRDKGIMPARADTHQGCKSWRAPLSKPHGDHHRTTHANANAIIYPMQVPILPNPCKLWNALVTISYFSECSEFHSFMSPLYTVRAEISELSTKGEQCCMSKNDLPSYFILRVYCLTKTVYLFGTLLIW